MRAPAVYLLSQKFLHSIRNRKEPNHAADLTYRPLMDTPHRTPPSTSFNVREWVTLAVEVGRFQSWASLEEAAGWWSGYEGIQYVMLMKISRKAKRMRYALYDITTLGILGEPVNSGTFEHEVDASSIDVSFDMHRILAIPHNLPLPEGVNATAKVDLRLAIIW